MEQRLNKKLINIKNENTYPFHMPGHKRNICKADVLDNTNESTFSQVLAGAYSIDITEIDGFDNLHDAQDVIKDAEVRASELYKSEETHFLVNGSTSGILSAISAVSNKGDKIIVARNCHMSVYNAIWLNELKPVYVYPEIVAKDKINSGLSGCITKEAVEKAILENNDICAVVITSPTYDGVLSDVSSIAKIVHEYDIPLIVDEAHGALFFMEGRSAVGNNADIVINSVHKTLPALTQTALLHINGKIVNRESVRKYLKIYQTSSPSYVLMGSIDYAIEVMEKSGKALYRDFCIRTVKLKQNLSKLRNLQIITKDDLLMDGVFDFDESKVLICVQSSEVSSLAYSTDYKDNIIEAKTDEIANKSEHNVSEYNISKHTESRVSGKDIYNVLLNKFKLQPEMAAGEYVLLMTTLFDSEEGIERLIHALLEIDNHFDEFFGDKYFGDKEDSGISENDEKLSLLKNSIDKPFQYTVFSYPPGIPIIVSGETVTQETVEKIEDAYRKQLDVKWVL